MNTALTLTLLIVVAVTSFVCSGMETGLFALSRARIRHLRRSGNRMAHLLHRYLENQERFFWTLLIGNTIANFVIVVQIVFLLYEHWTVTSITFWAVLVPSLFLFYALLDLLPKMLFRRHPNRMCILAARPFRLIDLILSPAVGLVGWFASALAGLHRPNAVADTMFGHREELRALMEDERHPLSTDERRMIGRVMRLQGLTIRQITTPWEKVTKLSAHDTVGTARKLFRENRLSRVPVVTAEGGKNRIDGVLSLRAILYRADVKADHSVLEFASPALILEDRIRLDDALHIMQGGGQRQAIVVNSQRREVGIVSLTDILRVMFGEVTW